MTLSKNVLGRELKSCCTNPITGFFRNGLCETSPEDVGAHVICVEVTEEFLLFSKTRGNDLSTSRSEFGFTGLKPGDRWCLCALRWVEAYNAGVAPPVVLLASHESALQYVSLPDLQKHSCG